MKQVWKWKVDGSSQRHESDDKVTSPNKSKLIR